MLVAPGFHTSLYALAIGADDVVLGESEPYYPEQLQHGNGLNDVVQAIVSSHDVVSSPFSSVHRWRSSGLSMFMGVFCLGCFSRALCPGVLTEDWDLLSGPRWEAYTNRYKPYLLDPIQHFCND